MAVPFSNTKLRVPKGFQNLLEGLAREVLRSQPQDIYGFGADYFKTLLKMRDEQGIDPTVDGAKLEDRFYNNKSFKEPEVDPSDPQQQQAALAIQTEYRRHAAEQEVEGMKQEAAATTIQAGARAAADQQPADQKPEEEEVDIDLNDPEVAAAATKIQAGFKGFKARKEVQNIKTTQQETAEAPADEKKPEEEEEVDIDLNDPEVAAAATKIQAGFKGFKARKEMRTTEPAPGTTEQSSVPTEESVQPITAPESDDPSEMDAAATKIQAGFKGYKARQEMNTKKAEATAAAAEQKPAEEGEKKEEEGEKKEEEGEQKEKEGEKKEQEGEKEEEGEKKEEEGEKKEEEVDIDLNDPEVAAAATKIQAGFKGFKTRKEMKDAKGAGEAEKTEEGGEGETQKEAPKEDETPKEEPEAPKEEEQKTEGESQKEEAQEGGEQ